MNDSWVKLRRLFHWGLGLALASILLAVVLGRLSATKWLEIFPYAYSAIGMIHVLLLGLVIQVSVDERHRVNAAGWLYTAGFVHTLAGLGVTLAIAGSLLAKGSGGIGTIVLPMGAAVVPHALAVWLGHTFEHSGASGPLSLEESIVRALADESIGARMALRKLYDERLESLKREVAALGQHLVQMEGLRSQTLSIATDVQNEIVNVNRAAKDLAAGLAAPATKIAASLQTGASSMEEASLASRSLRAAIDEAARAQSGFATEVRNATNVVGDLKKLQEAIVELLSSEIFRDGGRTSS